MMQITSLSMAACILGAVNLARGNHLLQEHEGASHASAVVDVPAGLEAAVSTWPVYTSVKTEIITVTKRPAWTTLSTMIIPIMHTKTRTVHTTTTPSIFTAVNKRDEALQTITLLPDGKLSTVSHKHKTTTVTPTVTHKVLSSSVTKNSKITVFQSTTNVLAAPTPAISQTAAAPPSMTHVSMTSISPKTKLSTTHTSTTITLPASKAVHPASMSHQTSVFNTMEVHTDINWSRELCRPGHIAGCALVDRARDFNKKWLWLLTIPLVLLLAAIPLCIPRRTVRYNDEEKVTSAAPTAAPMARGSDGRVSHPAQSAEMSGTSTPDGSNSINAPYVPTPAEQSVLDRMAQRYVYPYASRPGSRKTEAATLPADPRIPKPAGQTTQTVTSAPDGKIVTAPAVTVEETEELPPQHDGATSPARGRKVHF